MTGICDDASPETISKLVCRGCGYWEVHSANDVLVYHCGRPMVETYADQGLLTMDEVERVTHRWRRTDA